MTEAALFLFKQENITMPENPTKSKWQEYTREKRKLDAKPLTPEQYELEIAKLCKRLGV